MRICADDALVAPKLINIGDDVIRSLRKLMLSAFMGDSSSEFAASFLMAWYDTDSYGGFNPNDLWKMDPGVRDATITVIIWLGGNDVAPEDLDLDLVLRLLSERWVS